MANIARFGGAPALLGFGISTPKHVSDAITAGAAGAITGSAITAIIENHCVQTSEGIHINDAKALHLELEKFIQSMVKATKVN